MSIVFIVVGMGVQVLDLFLGSYMANERFYFIGSRLIVVLALAGLLYFRPRLNILLALALGVSTFDFLFGSWLKTVSGMYILISYPLKLIALALLLFLAFKGPGTGRRDG